MQAYAVLTCGCPHWAQMSMPVRIQGIPKMVLKWLPGTPRSLAEPSPPTPWADPRTILKAAGASWGPLRQIDAQGRRGKDAMVGTDTHF